MTDKEIIEGNKLIAEFMGLNYEDVVKDIWYNYQQLGYRNSDFMNFPENYKFYHSSWDWLMPVVEKIKNTMCLGYFNIDST